MLFRSGLDFDKVRKEVNSRPDGTGLNVKTGKYVASMIDEGVIDPTKVVRCAIENASSVAKTLLITEAVVYYTENHTAESIKMDQDRNIR